MNKRSILVVDDHKSFAESHAALFRRKGWVADFAVNGADAVERVTAHGFDAIILDMKMPEMDGFETLHRILEVRPDACVLFLTAYGETDAAVRALREGAVNLLLKPISFPTLLALVEDGIDRKRNERQARDKERAELEAARIQATLTLAMGMAHNIKNGLSAVATRLELLAGDTTEANRDRHVKEAGEILWSMDVAVRQLYWYGKAEQMPIGPVALRSAAARAVDEVRKRRDRSHAGAENRVEIDICPGLQAMGNADLLAEAVACVLDNAFDAAPDGVVRVSTTARGKVVDLVIRDDGPGFSSQLLGKAHQPFVGGRYPTHFGFGLTFVDQVARCCGGTLAYTNADDGHGAVITLSLPLA